MKIQTKNFVRLFLIEIYILTLFAGLNAQIRDSNSHWDFRLHKPETINYAKKYLASNIERRLPKMSFAAWLQKFVGAKSKINWKIVDCGVNDLLPETEKEYDLTICIETSAQITDEIFLRIRIEYGTFESRITRTKPIVRGIFLGDKTSGNGISLENLRDLPEQFNSIKKSLIYFDPYLGIFNISSEKPAGFENFSAMWIETMDYNSKGKYVPIKKDGVLEDNQIKYQMQKIYYDGKSWSFETAVVGGISYKFEGKFGKLKLDSHGATDGENILHGHLIKFLKGKKTAEADLIFSFHIQGC